MTGMIPKKWVDITTDLSDVSFYKAVPVDVKVEGDGPSSYKKIKSRLDRGPKYAYYKDVLSAVARVSSIMVPTGKIGPITPAKSYTQPSLPRPAAYSQPAPVWERIDETGSGYTPPIYKYILWDFVQKYGHHTLIARPQDYYNPPPRVTVKTAEPFYYKNYNSKSYNYKNKNYYSKQQFL